MNRKKIGYYLFILFTGIGIHAYGQEGPAVLSISDCINYAQQNNNRIQVARYDQDIAKQQVREIRGTGLPQANINGTFEDRLKIPQLIIPGFGAGFPGQTPGSGGEGIPMGYQYNTNLSGEVTQMIYNPSFWVGLRAAKSSTELYEQATAQVTEQTAYNIASAYYQTIVVSKQLQLLRSNLENTRQILNTTRLQYENGVAKQVDVNRLQVNTSNLESRVRQAELNLQQAENALKYQMGMPLDQPVILSDTTLSFPSEEVLTTGTPDQFVENRLDYRILQTNRDLENLNRRNINAGYQPTLFAYGNYGYVGQGPELGLFKTANNNWVDFTTASVGLRLRVPIFDGFQRSAQSQQSRIRTKQIDEQLDLTKQTVQLEVSNAEVQYRNTISRIEAEEENVNLAQQVYEVTQLEFREGVGSSTAVVEAETSLRQAQNTYITSLLDLYIARLNLEQAKGNLLAYINSK